MCLCAPGCCGLSAGLAPTPRAVPHWGVLGLLCVAPFMVVLDANIVTIALPSIRRDLGFSDEGLQWVISSYSLAFGGFLLVGGRAGDLYGRLRLLLLGLALFSIASLAGALAPSPPVLVASRALQGLGAAMAFPSALSLITSSFEEGQERNKALGTYGAVISAGLAFGVAAGGALTDSLGWRAVLLVNVPIGLAAMLAAPRVLRESRRPVDAPGLDLPGALAMTGALLVLLYAFGQAGEAGWLSTETLLLLAVAAALAAVTMAIEGGASEPLIAPRLFWRGTLMGASAAAMITAGIGVGVMFVLSLYLQEILGYGAIESGLALTLLGVAGTVAGVVAPRMAGRLGVLPVLACALAVQASGVTVLIAITADAGLHFVLVGTTVVGLGYFGATVMFTVLATAGIADEDQGVAMGFVNSAQQVGRALGLALLITVASARTDALRKSAESLSREEAVVEGFKNALAIGAALSALAAIAVLVAWGALSMSQEEPPSGRRQSGGARER